MEEYVPNSHKSRERKTEIAPAKSRNVKKVVKGSVKKAKKSEMTRLVEAFLPKDVTNVREYILYDVVVPMVKRALDEGFHMMLYGSSKRRDDRGSMASWVSYRSSYSSSERRSPRDEGDFEYDGYIIPTRGEAEDVLDRMGDVVDQFGKVTVADYCEMIGVRCPYTYDNYGWTTTVGMRVADTRDGYVIRMPRAVLLTR